MYRRILEFVASAFSIGGVALISTGNPYQGFWFSMVASFLYCVYALLTRQYFFLVSSGVYFLFDLVGIIHWKGVSVGLK